ncbi:hypothetical protein GCM10011581_11710 [Saccharopolyspora subtropica]|uniref:Uncharacterized protein n=1 Tax=Saccharopolyspora thermophila TaxID=89367 RepID=A0A917JQ57_9PSEU|nr:hypothetical protein GCM10011581_11710 [Saccharopolyspora subtropica]
MAEGLLVYLPAAAEAALLRGVHDNSAPGSRIAVEDLTTNRSLHPARDDRGVRS